jgi:hypothetical protein
MPTLAAPKTARAKAAQQLPPGRRFTTAWLSERGDRTSAKILLARRAAGGREPGPRVAKMLRPDGAQTPL